MVCHDKNKIQGFYSNEDTHFVLLGCDTVQSGQYYQIVCRTYSLEDRFSVFPHTAVPTNQTRGPHMSYILIYLRVGSLIVILKLCGSLLCGWLVSLGLLSPTDVIFY